MVTRINNAYKVMSDLKGQFGKLITSLDYGYGDKDGAKGSHGFNRRKLE